MNISERTFARDEHLRENADNDLLFSWVKLRNYLIIILAMFLCVIVPLWWVGSENASQRDMAQRELRLSQMQNVLATAVIEAQRGEYEPARQTLNEFFTLLQNQIDVGESSVLTSVQRENLKPLLAQRDELLESLARGDPAVKEQLSNLFISYRQGLNNTTQHNGA